MIQESAAISIIFSPDKKSILLVQRRDTPMWVLPGGGVDNGELPSDAAIREAFEETTVKVAIKRTVATYFPTNRMGRLTHVFECTPIEGEPQATAESRNAQYFPINKLPSAFFFIHQFWLEDALKNDPHIIEKPLEGVTYLQLIRFLVRHPWISLRYAISRLGLPWNSR